MSLFENKENNKLIWIDLELTGLDIKKDTIIEICCIITDNNLNEKDSTQSIVIHNNHEINNMDEWCLKTHSESGLIDLCKQSEITLEQAENMILELLKRQEIPKGVCPLAGNSVYVDMLFLKKCMPNLCQYLNSQTIIDVSGIKELCKRWCFDIYKKAPTKNLRHRSYDDIQESIAELLYYKTKFLNCS